MAAQSQSSNSLTLQQISQLNEDQRKALPKEAYSHLPFADLFQLIPRENQKVFQILNIEDIKDLQSRSVLIHDTHFYQVDTKLLNNNNIEYKPLTADYLQTINHDYHSFIHKSHLSQAWKINNPFENLTKSYPPMDEMEDLETETIDEEKPLILFKENKLIPSFQDINVLLHKQAKVFSDFRAHVKVLDRLCTYFRHANRNFENTAFFNLNNLMNEIILIHPIFYKPELISEKLVIALHDAFFLKRPNTDIVAQLFSFKEFLMWNHYFILLILNNMIQEPTKLLNDQIRNSLSTTQNSKEKYFLEQMSNNLQKDIQKWEEIKNQEGEIIKKESEQKIPQSKMFAKKYSKSIRIKPYKQKEEDGEEK